jgi:hypothetical protein
MYYIGGLVDAQENKKKNGTSSSGETSEIQSFFSAEIIGKQPSKCPQLDFLWRFLS